MIFVLYDHVSWFVPIAYATIISTDTAQALIDTIITCMQSNLSNDLFFIFKKKLKICSILLQKSGYGV